MIAFKSLDILPDVDIWRAAQLMVKRHGADAAIQAGMRADDLIAEGDVDGPRYLPGDHPGGQR